MGSIAFDYRHDPDTVLAMVTDPVAIPAQREALGDLNVQVDVSREEDRTSITCARDIETALPSFARRFFKPVNKVLERRQWDDLGELKRGQFSVDVSGSPIRIEGTITISPIASGARYAIEFEVRADVPLIRKKVEAFTEELTLEGMRAEYEFTRRQLETS